MVKYAPCRADSPTFFMTYILMSTGYCFTYPSEQARFLSCGGVGNALCFRAPSRQSRLHLDDWEFQVCCAIHLGHPIQPAPKYCNKSLSGHACYQDNTLFHPLSCKIGGGCPFYTLPFAHSLPKSSKMLGSEPTGKSPFLNSHKSPHLLPYTTMMTQIP